MPFTTKVPTFDAAAKTRNVQGMSSMSCSTKTDFGFDPFKQYKTVSNIGTKKTKVFD
jgi:hypothetical protein